VVAAKNKATKEKAAASKRATVSASNAVKKACASAAALRGEAKSAMLVLNKTKTLDSVTQAEAVAKVLIATMVDSLK
jgi:hypothetical protein